MRTPRVVLVAKRAVLLMMLMLCMGGALGMSWTHDLPALSYLYLATVVVSVPLFVLDLLALVVLFCLTAAAIARTWLRASGEGKVARMALLLSTLASGFWVAYLVRYLLGGLVPGHEVGLLLGGSVAAVVVAGVSGIMLPEETADPLPQEALLARRLGEAVTWCCLPMPVLLFFGGLWLL